MFWLMEKPHKQLEDGNCQVSTTIYNVAMQVPDVEILERHEHSKKVPYIEAGKDLEGKGFDPRKLLAPGAEAIKQCVKEKMEIFGCIGKA